MVGEKKPGNYHGISSPHRREERGEKKIAHAESRKRLLGRSYTEGGVSKEREKKSKKRGSLQRKGERAKENDCIEKGGKERKISIKQKYSWKKEFSQAARMKRFSRGDREEEKERVI